MKPFICEHTCEYCVADGCEERRNLPIGTHANTFPIQDCDNVNVIVQGNGMTVIGVNKTFYRFRPNYMKDRKIGDVFARPYGGMLKVVEAPDGGCAGCVFDGSVCQNTERYTTGECSARYRMDRTEVVFIKAKEENNGL